VGGHWLLVGAALLIGGCGRSGLAPFEAPPDLDAGTTPAPDAHPATPDARDARPSLDAGADLPPGPCHASCDPDRTCVPTLLDSTPSFAVAADPRSVTIGDLNGDGAPDLVVATYGTGEVDVLLGHGDGTFRTPRTVWSASGSALISLAIGDVDGDGRLDLVVGSFATHAADVLLGHGDGTFAPARTVAIGSAVSALASADLNGDGALDLMTIDGSTSAVGVLLGRGDGSFGAVQTVDAGGATSSLAVGDVDGDGRPDLAVSTVSAAGNAVTVLLGNGDGSFGAPGVSVGPLIRADGSLTLGDVDGDGKLDLVTTISNGIGALPRNTLYVKFGAGDGTFPSGATVAEDTVSQVAIADLDGDGRKDLAFAHITANDVGVVRGEGSGSFSDEETFLVGDAPQFVAAADLDGDGKADLVVVNSASNSVSVRLGGRAGGAAGAGGDPFRDPRNFAVGSGAESLAVGDLNGDGQLDLVVSTNARDSQDLPLFSNGVTVWLGSGDGMFRMAGFASEPDAAFVAVRDLNHDGRLDVVVVNYNTAPNGFVDVLLGNGDGTLQSARRLDGGNAPRAVAVGDVDGDGNLDLVVAREASNDVGVLLGDGTGGFGPARSFAGARLPSGPWSVALGDLDHDGDLDIVIGAIYSPGITVMLGNGDGTFAPAKTFGGNDPLASVTLADLNRDGTLDIAASDLFGSATVLIGRGDGSFGAPQTFAAGSDPSYITAADVNGDGLTDLLVASFYVSGVELLLGNGDGSFQAARFFASASGPTSVVAADFNRDGRLDLATANNAAGSVSVLLGVDQHECR
jgi:hypothetical protein